VLGREAERKGLRRLGEGEGKGGVALGRLGWHGHDAPTEVEERRRCMEREEGDGAVDGKETEQVKGKEDNGVLTGRRKEAVGCWVPRTALSASRPCSLPYPNPKYFL
jgi:hypothetical protein